MFFMGSLRSGSDKSNQPIATTQNQGRNMSKDPLYCGECKFLRSRMRTNIFPETIEFECGLLGMWIGFVADRRLSVCLPVLDSREAATSTETESQCQ